ncbi:amino acid adenylation domain-containing protein [Amycolatopsis sp. NPDC058340]|uniref:amino acid adenylation domain-containing protein n=1 Tax=Amycolatopsis sp. NPDC058340 TaxID=3346453 RepID=UPI003653ABEB
MNRQEKVSVHELFAAWAAKTPDAPAVVFAGVELTYAELDARANRLANRLAEGGVGPQTPVGVLLDRSPELVIALLAVLKAGGHYLALEPGEPAERAGLLLRDAGAKIVLTQRNLAAAVEQTATTLLLDAEQFTGFPDTAPRVDVGGDNTAYIAYTSGSTGTPKGVAVPHRAVPRLARPNHFLELGPGDTMLQLAPVAFDASTLELWAPLLSGARLAIFPPGDADPARIRQVVEDERVTALWLTAGLFHLVAETGDGRLPASLRYLLAGGDVLSVERVNRVLERSPGLTVVNGYGPTENTTFTCCQVLTEPVTSRSVPIGVPISGTEVHLLDDELRPVPDGTGGELYAGGEGVAHGYVGHPARTAERFLPDPFSGRPGARMYRTGDFARRSESGELEFLGRADTQVKIRGFRVEPGEAEAALRRHRHVTDCAVVAQDRPGLGRVLAGFVVGDRPITIPELRRELAASLPSYLVPATLVQLDSLPLTASGKVDRPALANARSKERPDCDADYRAPRTGTEQWLAQVWADLMELDRVGIDDDFFELGGHSLLATRITGEISATHDVLVTARAFYEHSTVAELAALIDEPRGDRRSR